MHCTTVFPWQNRIWIAPADQTYGTNLTASLTNYVYDPSDSVLYTAPKATIDWQTGFGVFDNTTQTIVIFPGYQEYVNRFYQSYITYYQTAVIFKSKS